MQPWFTVYFIDIGHPCYDQLTPVRNSIYADQYHVAHIVSSSLQLIEVMRFLTVECWPC